MTGDRGDRPARRHHERERVTRLGRGLVPGQGLLGDRCRAPQVVGVGQSLDLREQRRTLPRLRGGGLDLSQPQAQQLGVAQPLSRRPAQLLERGPHIAPLHPAGSEALPQREHRRAGEAVQGGALLGGPEQPLLVALPVHGDDVLGQLPQHADRDAASAQVSAGTSVGPDAATDQQRVVVELRAGVGRPVEGRVAGRQHQTALHDGALGPGSQPPGVRAPAEQQAQALHDHRLAGPGLAGDDRQTRPELQHGVVDDAEPADPHLLQHRPDTRPGVRRSWGRHASNRRSTTTGRRGRPVNRARRCRATPRRAGRTCVPGCR